MSWLFALFGFGHRLANLKLSDSPRSHARAVDGRLSSLFRTTVIGKSFTGVCEAQLWTFTGPPKVPSDDAAPEVCRVAAESLDEALRYLRQRYGDLQIMEARCTGMVALLSGSPLD